MQLFDPDPRMPSLDLDVLDTICAFLTEYPDFLSLSLTCSILRPIAIRNLLRNRSVVLKNPDIICKFHDFIFSDPATRLHYITSLRIDVNYTSEFGPERSERAINCLLAIMKHAPSLTSLELHPSAYGRPLGYLDDPRLAAAISALTTLQELTFGGRAEVDFIGAVRSPLKKLSVGFVSAMDDAELSPVSLSSKLSHVANSLENLSILYTPVRLVPAQGPPYRLSTQTQFHALRSLTLWGPSGAVRIHVLLDLFPNLDGTLRLTGFPEEVDGPEDVSQLPPYESFRAIRELNGAAQAQRSWKRLERLICRERMLFLLNVRCQIGVTIVHSYSPNLDGTPSPYLTESLRGYPPTRLNVQLRLSFREPQDVPLSGMIPLEAAGVLTHLTLCVKYQYKDPKHGSAARWDGLWRHKLRPILLDLHALTYLRFVFHCEAWRNRESNEATPVRGDTVLGDLRPATFDFASVARSIADAAPSLRYCFLTTSARVFDMLNVAQYDTADHWRESRAWRIAAGGSSGGNSTLVELHEDVAETIIAKEGLGLTTEEEEEMHWR